MTPSSYTSPENFIVSQSTSQKIFFLLAFSLLIFLSGCGNEENERETKNSDIITAESTKNSGAEDEGDSEAEKIPTVKVYTIKSENNSPSLSVSGTVVANEEVTVSAEASGVVSEVWKKEGEKVESGERILMLDAGHNLALSAYNSAQTAKANAATSLHLYQQSSDSQIKNAEISERQAQTNLEQAKRTQNSEKNSITAQVENSKAQQDLAAKNLEISKTALEQTKANEEKVQKNILENTGNTLSQTLVNFRSSMNMADELLGASAVNKKTNDEFAVYLEGTTIGIMLPSQDLWRQTDPKITAVEESFRNFEKDAYTQEDEEEMIALSNQTVENAKQLRIILRNLESMLKESIPSQTFPQSQIDSLKAQIVQHQNTIEANISQLTAADQSLSDFHLQSPQRITNAEFQVAVSEAQLLSAEQGYESLASSGSTNKIKVDSALTQAQQSYQAAKNAVESTKIQTEISIQGARAQYNSADAQLAQAEISLSKLTIRSGIQGTVSKILKKDGDTVSIGTPVVIISDYSSLKLKGDVSVSERLSLTEGMEAEVRIDDINQVFTGKISLISPEADKVTKRVAVEITIPNDANIPANIFATAKIILEKQEPEIFVPETAILREKVSIPEEKEKYKNFVYIAKHSLSSEKCSNTEEKGCFLLKKQEVEISDSFSEKSYNQVKIRSGVETGEQVIQDYRSVEKGELSEGDEIEVKK